jgi:hypothetical protein
VELVVDPNPLEQVVIQKHPQLYCYHSALPHWQKVFEGVVLNHQKYPLKSQGVKVMFDYHLHVFSFQADLESQAQVHVVLNCHTAGIGLKIHVSSQSRKLGLNVFDLPNLESFAVHHLIGC